MNRQDWRDYRHGDIRAFDRIYLRHKDRLYGHCLYTSGDPEMSRDVVQESFVKLLERKQGGGFDRGLDNWLFVCVRNCLYNHLKKRRVRQNHEYTQALTDGAVYNPGETRVMLQQVMARLDAQERELILMRELLGLTIPEIAVEVGVSEGAVRVRLHRVRKRMVELDLEG